MAQSRWYQFVSPDNDFSVSFPGQPQHKTSGSSPQLELYTFSFGQHTLSLGYQDILPPPQTPAQRAAALAASVSDQLQWISANGRLLRHAPLPDGGHEFACTSQLEAGVPLYSRDRIYVAGARYYHLTCLSLSPQGLDEALANQFLNSFRLPGQALGTKRVGAHLSTDAPAVPEEWQRAVSPDGDFVVEFPGQPKYEARLNAQTGVQVQGYAFPFGDLQFILTFQELLDPPETPAERDLRLKEVQTGVLSDRKLSLVRQARLPDGGRELLCQTEMNGRPAFMLLRLYVHGTRLYVLTCTAAERSKLAAPAVARHFASFRFTR